MPSLLLTICKIQTKNTGRNSEFVDNHVDNTENFHKNQESYAVESCI